MVGLGELGWPETFKNKTTTEIGKARFGEMANQSNLLKNAALSGKAKNQHKTDKAGGLLPQGQSSKLTRCSFVQEPKKAQNWTPACATRKQPLLLWEHKKRLQTLWT